MARKIPGLQRVLDAPALVLGRLRRDRLLALLRARHRRAARARPDALGAARRRRRSSWSSRSRTRRARPRSRRPAAPRPSSAAPSTTSLGFLTGWALFLDYLIVIALVGALRAALPRRGDRQWGSLEHKPVGRGRRRRRRSFGVAAVRLVRRSAFYRSGSSSPCSTFVDPAAARRARLRLPLLGRRAHAGRLDSGRARRWQPDRVRAAAGDARLHRAGDGREPRRGDARARARPPAQPLRRDRRSWSLSTSRSRCVGALERVPGRGRHDRARHGRGCARR